LAVLAAGTLSAIRPVRSRVIDLTGPAVAVAVDR
jgi:hypothetical protein